MSRLFAQRAAQDAELFSRMLVELHVRLSDEPQRQFDLFYGSAVRARHSGEFLGARAMFIATATCPHSLRPLAAAG
ncbi:MAG: hypothetical protein U5Q16_12400 [Gammaproteobacteria bacterium]|nr:hypothetical protein [Gammaproteobacteria bacterium]